MVHSFNPSLALQRQRQLDLCEVETSLIYRVISRTDRVTQRNPVLKKTKREKHLLKSEVFPICYIDTYMRVCIYPYIYIHRVTDKTKESKEGSKENKRDFKYIY